jgi:hypothetical protein
MNITTPGTRKSIDKAVRIESCLKTITETITAARPGNIKKRGFEILNSLIMLSAIRTIAIDRTNSSIIPLTPYVSMEKRFSRYMPSKSMAIMFNERRINFIESLLKDKEYSSIVCKT